MTEHLTLHIAVAYTVHEGMQTVLAKLGETMGVGVKVALETKADVPLQDFITKLSKECDIASMVGIKPDPIKLIEEPAPAPVLTMTRAIEQIEGFGDSFLQTSVKRKLWNEIMAELKTLKME